MPISSTTRLDTAGFMRQYHSTVDLSASASATYYKCATVDTEEETWTGYKRLTSTAFGGTFALTTTSLTYTGVPPVVGLVYDSTGQMNVLQPMERNLVFHAPLSASATHAATGQALTTTGTPTFQTTNGVPCAYLDGSAYISFPAGFLPAGNEPFTISFWSKITSFSSSPCQLIYGVDSQGYCVGIYCTSGGNQSVTKHGQSSADSLTVATDSNWHNIGLVSDSTTTILYVDGSAADSVNMSWSTTATVGYIGRYITDVMKLTGYMAGIRIYTDAFSASKMLVLADEYTVTT